MTEQNEGERLYILGHPVAHSKSPVMYNAVYGKLGLPWHYDFADQPQEEGARAFVDARDFLSINITTPYKPLAFESATRKAASAKLAQGANVLVRKDSELIGFNTDGEGCVRFLELAGVSFKGKRVVVCGTGPTAISILHNCALAGADVLLMLSRTREHGEQVLNGYLERYKELAYATIDFPAEKEGHRSFREGYEKPTFKFGTYGTSKNAINAADIIINATPLGMNEGDPAPFDTSLLRPEQVVFDAVYASGQTQLVHDALALGCKAYNGGGMLVAQAVATVFILADIERIDVPMSEAEMFNAMADAAEFDCPRA